MQPMTQVPTSLSACPVKTATEVMGGKWKPGLLYNLAGRRMRLSQMRREMPWISERVLIRQLKELARDGIVERRDHGEMPPRTDYALTPYGETLMPVLDALADWGARHVAGGRRQG